MINRLFMSGSKGDGAVSALERVYPLAQPGQGPGRSGIGYRSLPTVCFRLVKHATAEGCGNADHSIQLMITDELAPLRGDVEFILRLDPQLRGKVNRLAVEEQVADLMTGRHNGPRELERAPSRRVLRTG